MQQQGFTYMIYYNQSINAAREYQMCAAERPNIKTAIDNLKQSLPIGRKIGLLIRNSFVKITRLKSCCGHPGEPGC
jgi:hypothetical protein